MEQIEKLSKFILEECEGYPNANEGAGDCAIRIIKNFKASENKEITDIPQIDTSTEIGKLFLAAIAKITTESQTDKTPNEVLEQLNTLKGKMDF